MLLRRQLIGFLFLEIFFLKRKKENHSKKFNAQQPKHKVKGLLSFFFFGCVFFLIWLSLVASFQKRATDLTSAMEARIGQEASLVSKLVHGFWYRWGQQLHPPPPDLGNNNEESNNAAEENEAESNEG